METALEHILTKSYKADIMSYMDSHPEDFEEAITLAISNKQPYCWRASWMLWSCMEENDIRIRAYVKKIVDILTTKKDNHLRELLKILHQMEINEEYEGKLFNICVKVWEQINKKPSVRFNAFIMIVKIAKKYPDLYNEIFLLTHNQYLESLSPGVRRSIFRMIKALLI